MKNYINFIRKEFKHILRDKLTLMILFGMPIAQMLIFGYVVKDEIKNIPFAVLDMSKDAVTKEIISKMEGSGYFILEQELSSQDQIEAAFKKGTIREVIVFEQDFAEKLQRENTANVQIIADATDANTANLITGYTQGVILKYVQKLNNTSIPYQVQVQERMLFNPDMKSSNMFVPGIMALILMLISAMLTSLSIAREKELGTMSILLISPLKPSEIIIGKLVPYLILSAVNGLTVLLIGHFIFGVPITGNLVLLMSVIMLYILLSLAMGLLISTAAKTQEFAMFVSMFALMLPSMLLSGFIYPIENMPLWLQVICQIVPPKWFLSAIKAIMLKGVGLGFIWKEVTVLSFMTLFFIVAGIKKFKVREE